MEYLESLIKDYRPSHEASELVRQTQLALLTGISGAGKDTIKRALMHDDITFHDIVSHTTRGPRHNNNKLEVGGVDYHFISNEEAIRMLENHEFIEAKFVHGTVYGTSVAEIQKAHDDQKVAITDVDVQGVSEFKKLSDESISIFVVPPSYDIWIDRLKSRYSSEDEFRGEWTKRRNSSIKELTSALDEPYYHFIINDNLDRATRVSREIIMREDVFYEKDNKARIQAQKLLNDILLTDENI